MRFRTRITASSIILAIVPLLIASILIGSQAYESGKGALRAEVQSNLISRRNLKQAEVEAYIHTIEKQIITQAASQTFIQASEKFIPAFDHYLTDTTIKELNENLEAPLEDSTDVLEPATPPINTDAVNIQAIQNTQGLLAYYDNEFHKTYQEKNHGKQLNINTITQSIGDTGLALQAAYIGNNPNPLGAKDTLNSQPDGSRYADVHNLYHPGIRTFLSTFGYYDIFIVDPKNGNVVYSVFKEMDYATSLDSGPYKDSGLAQAYNIGKQLTTGKAAFTQFEPYTPSYESPAGFVSSPIIVNGQLQAVLIFQMPVDALNDIMTFSGKWKEAGMGNSAEIYLVDKNKHILNNSRFFVEDPTAFINLIRASGFNTEVVDSISDKQSNIGLLPVNSPGVNAALSGTTGFDIFDDYRQVPVASAFSPIKAGELGWVILSEVDVAEAYSPIKTLRRNVVTSAALVILI
jgi:methyl-accepting chemotaxis protein